MTDYEKHLQRMTEQYDEDGNEHDDDILKEYRMTPQEYDKYITR